MLLRRAVSASARHNQSALSSNRGKQCAQQHIKHHRALTIVADRRKTIDLSSLKSRHFDDLFSFSAKEIDGLLTLSQSLKDYFGAPGARRNDDGGSSHDTAAYQPLVCVIVVCCISQMLLLPLC